MYKIYKSSFQIVKTIVIMNKIGINGFGFINSKIRVLFEFNYIYKMANCWMNDNIEIPSFRRRLV